MFDRIAERMAALIAEKVGQLTSDAWIAGWAAGYDACSLKNREDQNKRLMDMFRRGKAEGRKDALAEVGEIDGSWFEALTDMAEEEAAARLKLSGSVKPETEQ